MRNKTKLLVIGLDGASFDLLDPWIESGELPNLYKLKKEGSSGNLQTVPNLHSAAAWTSMVTGKNPGKHGIFFFVERDKEFNYKFFSGADRKSEAIWKILSENGKKIGVVNVPMTFPAEAVNGIFVSGLDAPSIKNKRSIFPLDLVERYKILRENYDLVPSVDDLLRKGRPDIAVEKWLKIASFRADFCKQLFQDYSFDFFMVTFVLTDWANHNLWKYNDKDYPLFNKKLGEEFGHLMLKTYKKIDSLVGELIDSSGPDTNVFIVSDHGAGGHQLASFYLFDWLVKNNFVSLKKDTGHKNTSSMLYKSLLNPIRKLIPVKLKNSILGKYPSLSVFIRHTRKAEQSVFKFIDWSKTKAYTEFKYHNIWINLKGRQKYGIVSPGKEYDELCENLKIKLLDWKEELTGKKVVERVFHKSELYEGSFAHRAPDLQIWWNDDVVISPEEGKKISPKLRKRIENEWSGDHRRNGIFMACGPQIKKGLMLNNLSIYDVAPTFLYLLDCALPQDLDGKIIKEALCE